MRTDRQVHPERGGKTPDAVRATLTAGPFRRYLIGQLTSNTGTWMQRAAQDLLVLHLTGNSGGAVGVVTALQFLPQTLFGLVGGILADRFPRRTLLLITQSTMAALSLLLGILTITGSVTLAWVFALAFALGTATAVDAPARGAFIPELVGRTYVAAAVSLNSAQFNVARFIGPALAGLAVAAAGTGPVFLVNAASYLAVLYGLITLPTRTPRRSSGPRRGATRPGAPFRHIAATPELLLPVTVIAVVGTFGLNFQVTLSVMAVEVFHSGPAAYGCLSAAYAAGSLVGALLTARRGRPPTARLLVTATVVFGTLEATLGLMPGYAAFTAFLVPTGLAAATVTTTANTLTQLHTDPGLRGRVMSVYFLVLLGGTPVGAPLVGLVSDTFGARSSLVLGGLISASSALALSALVHARQAGSGAGEASGSAAGPRTGAPGTAANRCCAFRRRVQRLREAPGGVLVPRYHRGVSVHARVPRDPAEHGLSVTEEASPTPGAPGRK
ncbi:MFS transporter [Streptomyces sp. NPDC096198]|uniref:MFS transporter n=1 Tax=Streptomyces sp. NPDC096198 TaxID=3366080 RepID=UPI0037FF38DE